MIQSLFSDFKKISSLVTIFEFISMEEIYILLQVYPVDLVMRHSKFLICQENFEDQDG